MNSLISLSFDDGCALDMKLVKLLQKHGLTATFYVPAMWESYNRMKGWEPLSKDQVQYLADNFEIGSHTITHPLLTRIPWGAAEYEIKESKKMLEEMFGVKVNRFCYPRGYGTDQIRDIVRQHYAYGRNTIVGSTDFPDDPVWENTSVHLACQRREYGNDDWYTYAMKMLRSFRRKKNGYFHAWGHSHEIEKLGAWNAIDRFFAEVKGVMDDTSSELPT